MHTPRRFALPLFVLLLTTFALHEAALTAEPEAKPVDLLKMINARRDTVKGRWIGVRGVLLSDATQNSVVQIPYLPPEEYDIEIDAEALRGNQRLALSLPIGRNQPEVLLDGDKGTMSGISRIDGKYWSGNEATFHGRVFPDVGAITIVCRVRRNGLAVVADDKKVIDWKGDPSRLSFNPNEELPNKRAIGLRSFKTAYRITRMELRPVTGEGERLK